MQLNSRRDKDVLIVELCGELDHHHADEARERLDEMLKDTSIKHMVFDLSKLQFMDSSGIGVFLGRYRTIARRSGQACLAAINPQLDRILEISGLYKVLKVYDSVGQAIKGIREVQ